MIETYTLLKEHFEKYILARRRCIECNLTSESFIVNLRLSFRNTSNMFVCLFVWLLWHIKLCLLFNAKSIL